MLIRCDLLLFSKFRPDSCLRTANCELRTANAKVGEAGQKTPKTESGGWVGADWRWAVCAYVELRGLASLVRTAESLSITIHSITSYLINHKYSRFVTLISHFYLMIFQ